MAETLDELFVSAGGWPHLLTQAVDAAAKSFADALSTANDLLAQQIALQCATFERLHAQALSNADAAGKAAHSLTASSSEFDCLAHGASCEPWDSRAFWDTYVPHSSSAKVVVPRLTRIGVLSDSMTIGNNLSRSYVLPALLPVLGHGSVLFSGSGAMLDAARAALTGLLLRLLAALPPGRLRLTLADHAHKGRAFSSLLNLHKTLIGDMVWHEPRHIDDALKGLIEHMSTVIQKYLTNQFIDLDAYNEAAIDTLEPYRILAISDFPAGFNRESAERVLSIARNGRQVGVYVILTLDEMVPIPHGFNLSELERSCTIIRAHGDHFRWVDPVLGRAKLSIDDLPSREVVDRIIKPLSEAAVQATQVKVDFARFIPTSMWRESSRDGIRVPIGRRGARDDQYFELGNSQGGGAHHALVAGRVGMGKSVLLHSIIMGLCLRYNPNEIELYLIDFKEGVEFEAYRRLPHARVIAIESEREFGLSVLEGLRDELNIRGERFKRAEVANLSDFRKRSTEPLPRIILLVDEFQVFFENSDKISRAAAALLDDITRRGRSFGIHIILSSQTISSSNEQGIEQSTLSQIGLRIALALNQSDSYRVLSSDNDAAWHLENPGEAIYNDKAGHIGANSRFQVAYISGAELRSLISSISTDALQSEFNRKPIVFEGNSHAQMSNNHELVALTRTRLSDFPRAVSLFIGEPSTIQARHISFRLRRQSRSNLLILGQNEAETLSTFLAALASFSIGLPPQSADIYILNLANVDDPAHDVVNICKEFDQRIHLGGRIHIIKTIDTLYNILKGRREIINSDESRLSPILLAIFGIQRARDLYRDGFTAPDAGKKLSLILRDGPDFAVHSIITVDTHAGLLRCLEQKDLNEFDGRAVFSSGDAGRVLGDHSNGFKLKPAYGVLFEPETPDILRKFKCYDLSLVSWLRSHHNGNTSHV